MTTFTIKQILENMFDDKSFNKVIEHMESCSMLSNEDSNLVDSENNYQKEELISQFTKLMESTQEDYRQDSQVLSGYNGVYPFIKAEYGMFEPTMKTIGVNMKEVANNTAGTLDLGLFVKEDSSKPAMIVLFAEPRNDGTRMFVWFVE